MSKQVEIRGLMLCAFLDILGFRRAVHKGAQDRSTAPGQLLGKYQAFIRAAARHHPNVKLLCLSDSAFILADPARASEFMNALLFVQQQSFVTGVMVRGGVALGEVVVDDLNFVSLHNYWGRLLFGEAVIEAVERVWIRS